MCTKRQFIRIKLPNSFFKNVIFNNNSLISTRKLSTALPIRQNSVFHKSKLNPSFESINKLQIRNESKKSTTGDWFLHASSESNDYKNSTLYSIGKQKILKFKNDGNLYHEKVVLGYSRAQMCDLVFDVANYKDFVPFCINSEILTDTTTSSSKNLNRLNLNLVKTNLNLRKMGSNDSFSNSKSTEKKIDETPAERSFKAKLEIGYPPIRESYVSHVNMNRPHMVKAISRDTRLFEYLINEWKFHPYIVQPPEEENCCIVEFYVSFKFRSIIYTKFAHLFMDQVFGKMVHAFTNRAALKYGKASMESKVLSK